MKKIVCLLLILSIATAGDWYEVDTCCETAQWMNGDACADCDSKCSTCNYAGSSDTDGCVCVVENCSDCDSDSVCTECASGYRVTDDDTCEACTTGCTGCSAAAATCTACSTGYALNDGENTCDECEANCDTCDSGTVCTDCASGYYLDSEDCTACAIDNATACSDEETATSCDTGYQAISGACV